MTFTIYHGNASLNDLEMCDRVAPGWRHGCQQTPQWRIPSADPWIMDNGAYVAWQKNERWSYIEWMQSLDNVLRKDIPEPEWIVMPDVPTEPEETYRRTERYLGIVEGMGFSMYFAGQDGMDPGTAVQWAHERGMDGIFLGGSMDYKKETATEYVEECSDRDMACHIARPGDLCWAISTGADSVDTTTYVRNQAWDKLREEYTTIEGGQSTLVSHL